MEDARPYINRAELLFRAGLPAFAIAVVTALLIVGLDMPALRTLALWTAEWTGLVLTALGAQVTVSGTVVASEAFALDVVTECLALGPMLLFVAAVLAYPKSMSYKTKGLPVGVAAIMGVNLIRIVSLFFLGSIFPQLLEVIHLLVWQSLMVLLAVAVWLIWSQDQFKSGNDGLLQKVFWALAALVMLCLAWLGVAGEYNQAVASA